MRVLRRPALSVAILSLLSGTGQEFFGVSGIGSIAWQWTDFYLGTPLRMRPTDDPRRKESTRIIGKVLDDWRQRRQLQGNTNPKQPLSSDILASAFKHGLNWEPPIHFGQNPLHLLRPHEDPWASVSRLSRMQEEYWPLIKEYFDAPVPERKKLLDAWIPPINDATLEAKLKKATEEQWRLEIGPGQKNDPYRLPRNIRDGARIARRDSRHFFGEDAKEGNAWSASNNWILDLERTFGFGYQLLRSCAIDGYDERYFRDVEKKWGKVFQETHNWVKRVLNAMQPPPGVGLAGDEVGEDEKASKATRADRFAFWSSWKSDEDLSSFLKGFRSTEAEAIMEDFVALLGWGSDASGEGYESRDEEEGAKMRDAVRSILELPADSAFLNKHDSAQRQTGGRLSRYPKTLTLEEKSVFRARRSVIEGERQTEDLRIYAGEGLHVLQSALLPFTYSYKSLWRQRDEKMHNMWAVMADIRQELENAVDTNSESLSPKAKAVARHAMRVLEETPKLTERRHYLERRFSTEVPSQLDESPDVVYRPYPWEEEIHEKEARRVDDFAGNACVRLFAWAKRHQVLSRMARLNLATRLKVLVDDGANFGGELSKADLVERETPTAVGPVVGKSGSPLALKENQNYTNLFYLLRDNVGKKLEEFPPLKWQDFDEWAKQYPHLVRTTPWDEEYVPPWEWPNGVTPDRRQTGSDDDDSYYRSWFVAAVTGIAVFTLGLVIVLVVLILECRRSAALQRRSQAKKKVNDVGQEQSPEPDRPHSGAQPEQQQGAAPACSTPKVRFAAGEKEDRAQRPARTRTADYHLYVRDQQPQPRSVVVPGAIDPGVPHDHGLAGRGALRGHPLMMQPLVQEWQAVMGLQLHSHSPEVDEGQGRLLPPPVNPHAPAGAGQPHHERVAAISQSHLDSPPLPGQYIEVEGKLLGAIGLVVPDGDTTSKDTLRAPPNSRATGASETEGAPTSSCAGCAV